MVKPSLQDDTRSCNILLSLKYSNKLQNRANNKKRIDNLGSDTDFNSDHLKWVIDAYKDTVERFSDLPFPQDPQEQLLGSVKAVFNSWLNKRAVTYRKINNIPDNWGTGATIQTMVFGNLNENSGTGVAFSRFPSTGKNELYGEYLMNAQGEDVVAGLRTPLPITKHEKNKAPSLVEEHPKLHEEIREIATKLENHYKEVQDIEFTIEDLDE